MNFSETTQTVTATDVRFNPFPGLRPFTIEESHLFFGREGQSDEVLMKLYNHRFVAVVGPSGSGKSSFIYCGVVPILYGGFLSNKTSSWNVVVARPGASPIDNLAEAIVKKSESYQNASEDDQLIQKTITTSLLKSSSLGLIEAVMQTKELANKNTLILIDQFEELFRFRRSEDGFDAVNEALAFVNLLMEAVRYKDVPIYVAITMRSDFIGECAFFPELTSAINDSYYMIPQMTREQKRMAITGPVAVGGGEVTPRLVQRLLNDLGDNPDQLPILQHSLMRTWDYWSRHREGEEPMDTHHYDSIGTMSEALSLHANEAYDELTEGQKRVCESVFKSLTEKGGDQNQGVRRPTKISEIAAIAGAREEDVISVIEKFREPGRSLLTPAVGTTLNSDSIIDISHESLMRIWVRLKNWVEEESEAIQMYVRLSDASAMYQIGKAGLWRPPDLQLALNWKEKHRPTLVWAQRYNPAFERTMVFLDYSQKEYETEQKVKEMLQKRTLRRTRLTALILGLFTIVAIAFLVYAMAKRVEADQQRALADKQTVLAKENAQKAEQQRKEAEKQKIEAEKAQKDALAQKDLAEEAKDEAEKQKIIAEQKSKEAIRSAEQARVSEGKAKANEAKANLSAEEAKQALNLAEKERAAAEKARKDAYNLRLLSIAQSMALKSTQLSDDPELQSLNAQQAYKFHSENGGGAFHPDIYTGLYYALKTQEGTDFNQLKGHTDKVSSIVPALSGRYVYSASSDGQVLKFDVDNPKNTPEVLLSGSEIIKSMAMSSDGKNLVAGGASNVLSLLDVDNKSVRKIAIPAEAWYVSYPSRAKNGFALVASNRKVYFYDNTSLKLIDSPQDKVNALAMTADGKKILIGDSKGQIISYDVANPQNKEVLYSNGTSIKSVRVSHGGRYLAVGDENGKLKVFDLQNKNSKPLNLFGHSGSINEIVFSNDDKQMATGSFDKTVRVWNTVKWNSEPMVFRDYDASVWSLGFNADGTKLVAGTRENEMRVWYTSLTQMSDKLCSKIKHNMSDEEWNKYVADDIQKDNTCGNLPPRQ